MAKSPDAFRTISEVAEWLDTPAHVLRFWESKFSQVKPVKRAGGRRYYRPADMQLLGGIKKLLHDDGMTIKGAQKMLNESGVAAISALSQPLEDDLADAVEAAPAPAEPVPTAKPAPRPTPQDAAADEVSQETEEAPPGIAAEPTKPEPQETAAPPATDTPAPDTPAPDTSVAPTPAADTSTAAPEPIPTPVPLPNTASEPEPEVVPEPEAKPEAEPEAEPEPVLTFRHSAPASPPAAETDAATEPVTDAHTDSRVDASAAPDVPSMADRMAEILVPPADDTIAAPNGPLAALGTLPSGALYTRANDIAPLIERLAALQSQLAASARS